MISITQYSVLKRFHLFFSDLWLHRGFYIFPGEDKTDIVFSNPVVSWGKGLIISYSRDYF